MTNKVVEHSPDSLLNRMIRDHALVAAMLFMAVLALVSGVIIGVSIATMQNLKESTNERYDRMEKQHAEQLVAAGKKYEKLANEYEITGLYIGNLHAFVKAQGLEPPPPPPNEPEN